MNLPDKLQPSSGVASIALFGIVLIGLLWLVAEFATSAKLALFAVQARKRGLCVLFDLRLQIRILLLKIRHGFRVVRLRLRLCLLEVKMILNRTRVGSLKHGYLSCDEGDQTPHFMLWCNAVINHRVEIIKEFLECFHNHWPWQRRTGIRPSGGLA